MPAALAGIEEYAATRGNAWAADSALSEAQAFAHRFTADAAHLTVARADFKLGIARSGACPDASFTSPTSDTNAAQAIVRDTGNLAFARALPGHFSQHASAATSRAIGVPGPEVTKSTCVAPVVMPFQDLLTQLGTGKSPPYTLTAADIWRPRRAASQLDRLAGVHRVRAAAQPSHDRRARRPVLACGDRVRAALRPSHVAHSRRRRAVEDRRHRDHAAPRHCAGRSAQRGRGDQARDLEGSGGYRYDSISDFIAGLTGTVLQGTPTEQLAKVDRSDVEALARRFGILAPLGVLVFLAGGFRPDIRKTATRWWHLAFTDNTMFVPGGNYSDGPAIDPSSPPTMPSPATTRRPDTTQSSRGNTRIGVETPLGPAAPLGPDRQFNPYPNSPNSGGGNEAPSNTRRVDDGSKDMRARARPIPRRPNPKRSTSRSRRARSDRPQVPVRGAAARRWPATRYRPRSPASSPCRSRVGSRPFSSTACCAGERRLSWGRRPESTS